MPARTLVSLLCLALLITATVAVAGSTTRTLDRRLPLQACVFPRVDCAERTPICSDDCTVTVPTCGSEEPDELCCIAYGDSILGNEAMGEDCATAESTDLTFDLSDTVVIEISRNPDADEVVARQELGYLLMVRESDYQAAFATELAHDNFGAEIAAADACDTDGATCCAREVEDGCYVGDGRPTLPLDGDLIAMAGGNHGFEERFGAAAGAEGACYFTISEDPLAPRSATWEFEGGAEIETSENFADLLGEPVMRQVLAFPEGANDAVARLIVRGVDADRYVLHGYWFSASGEESPDPLADSSGAIDVTVIYGDEAEAFDADVDGILDGCDNCPDVPNGNCDQDLSFCDWNGDGMLNDVETSRGFQADSDGDGEGDACEDRTPPVTTAIADPAANENGWNNTDVLVTLSALDEEGGTGVVALTYELVGAQIEGPTTVDSDMAMVTIVEEGETTVLFYAADFAGNVEETQELVIRIDKTAPELTCSVTPEQIWPPNGKMVDVVATVEATDDGAGTPGFVLDWVSMDESLRMTMRSDNRPYMDGWELGTADTEGQVRARRSGRAKSGRVYALDYSATDLAGNVGSCTLEVLVPHDQRPGGDEVRGRSVRGMQGNGRGEEMRRRR